MQPNRDVAAALKARVFGQDAAIDEIVPFVNMHASGLAPEGRPAGVFLLLGPTGTGKTKTVEALAEVLHGSEKHMLRIDCAEFQLEHEVAKLIGAPPGYIGHRESHPLLTQAKLSSITSEYCPLSLVLFDEIEKAAPSLRQLLLGILDKGTLRLGDGNSVKFDNALIFLTSNLGAKQMQSTRAMGLPTPGTTEQIEADRVRHIGLTAVKKFFSPEFVNRLDATAVYRPLTERSFRQMLEKELAALQSLIIRRLGVKSYKIHVSAGAKNFLVSEGTSQKYGGRELKRTIYRHITRPLSALVLEDAVQAGDAVYVLAGADGLRLEVSRAVMT